MDHMKYIIISFALMNDKVYNNQNVAIKIFAIDIMNLSISIL